ncbi:Aminotransferases class-IV [Prochlorococcus marinus str. MIT 9515]|uniref:Aminotransferases class-IV n=1 Tax=Prochlorococcus marinus (strain MIT 9515) TaxID=167542 RepID=A2BZ80_PROM5|nr:aminotransferase class IV [Prochlorococcus marinus]ABM73091.1 Aminotransferases class-IV [Prochlorococcus marinus str. MIT 9515]
MTISIGWHKDQWLKIEDICISANDRGLKFGDGIFETILIKNNNAILLDEHLHRLENSSKILNIDFNINKFYLKKIISLGIKKLSLKNNQLGSIRINYSRGLNKGRSIRIRNSIEENNSNNLWIEFYIIESNFSPISTFISQTEKRNQYSLINQCKTFSYNQSIQVLLEAKTKSFDDCLMLNTTNELCCGSTFNILLKRNNIWFTPRKESGCLQGIMVSKAKKLKLIKEDLILPKFYKDDILIAINSLSCRQIKKVNEIEFISTFDPKYFWELLYN